MEEDGVARREGWSFAHCKDIRPCREGWRVLPGFLISREGNDVHPKMNLEMQHMSGPTTVRIISVAKTSWTMAMCDYHTASEPKGKN